MWESGTSDGAKKGWFDRKLANAPTIHDDDEISDTSKFQNVIESLTSESSGKVFADFMKRGDTLTDEEVNSMSVDQYRKWLKKVNKGIKNTSIGDSWY